MAATIKTEYVEFLIPEQQVDVAISSRRRIIPFLEDSATFDSQKLPNRHVETLVDEFSRNFIVVGVGKNELEHTPVLKYRTPPTLRFPHEDLSSEATADDTNESNSKDDEAKEFQDVSRLLLHYHPGFVSSTSSLRNIPGDECRAYLSDYSSTDVGLLVNAIRINVLNVHLFEPIFLSLCLFYLPASSSAQDPEKAIRVSESLYVDFTPEEAKKQFNEMYTHTNLDSSPIVPQTVIESLDAFERLVRAQDDDGDATPTASSSATPTTSRARRSNVATSNVSNAVHPCTICSRGVFQIPAELKNGTLYLVAQIDKVLSGDADKALEPYIRKKGCDMAKLTENILRLSSFRQPLFIGACKIFDDAGVLKGADKNIMLCKLKAVPSEKEIGQFLIEGVCLGGAEGPISGDDNLADKRCDVSLQVGFEDIGAFGEVPKNLATSVANSWLFPADYIGPAQAVVEAGKFPPFATPVRLCSHVALRQDVESMTDVSHKMFTSFRNSLFVYPLEFERFQNRNLCLKVEVCELAPNLSVNQNDLIAGATRLPCIYNRSMGPAFTTCAYTNVTYHAKAPLMNEEIKIRLPDRLNENHNVIFSVYHVHVKPKTSLFSRKSVAGQPAYELVGVGALPLLPNRSNLISNDTHAVLVQAIGTVADDDDDGDATASEQAKGRPTRSASSVTGLACMLIRVRTRAYSSIYPVEDRIFSCFSNCPPPLGSLQTSKIEIRQAVTVTSQANSSAVIASLEANKLDVGGVTAMSNPLTAMSTTAVVASKTQMTNYPLPRILCAPSLRGATSEQQLRDVVKNIRSASSSEVSLHFLGIMRFLIRIMLGGNGRFSLDFANPRASPLSRCEAFLSMLSVFGNIAPNVVTSTERGRYNLEDLLMAYVDFYFDEEMAETYEQYQRRQITTLQASATAGRSSITSSSSNTINAKDVDDQVDQYAEYVIDQSSDAIIEEILRNMIKTDAVNDSDVQSIMMKETGIASAISPRQVLRKAQSRNRKVDFAMSEASHAETKDEGEFSATLSPLMKKMQKLEGFSSSRKLQLKKFLRGDVAESKSGGNQRDEEEDEEEEDDSDSSSPIGADPPPFKWWPWLYEVILSQWYCLMCTLQGVGIEGEDEAESYPISKEDIESARFQATDQTFRSLVLDHGSLLFRMILKSLAIRVQAEEKQFPIILDEATVSSLASLVKYLSLEIMSRKGHQWHCEVLNKSLANFIKQLFAFVAPVHIVRLVEAYVSASRSKHTVEEIDFRINFLDMVSSFDYYVAVNNPCALSKIARVRSRPARPAAAALRPGAKPAKSWNGGTMMRGVQSAPNQWLATVMIEELGPYLSHELSSIRLSSLRVIRGLLVGHSYDMRFGSLVNRQRVAAMYAKLIDTLVLKTDEISVMTPRTVERKELLVVFLYLLEECPESLLKDMWRDMCRPTMYKSAAKKKPASSEASRQRLRAAMAGDTSKPGEQGPVELQIMRVLKLLHLCIESFEQPMTVNENDVPTALLVPGLELQGFESDNSRASMKRGGGLKGADALAALNEVMKGSVSKGRRGESRLKAQDNAAGGEVKRSWKDNRAAKAVSTMRKTLGVSADLNPASVSQASRWITHETTRIVSKTLLSIVKSALPVLGMKTMSDDDGGSQATNLLVSLTKSKFSSVSFLGTVQQSGVLTLKNPALGFLDSVRESPADGMLKITLRVALHELCSNTSSLALEGVYEMLCRVVFEFGGRKFLMTVGDLLQDWLRLSLTHMNSGSPTLSSCASVFVALFFRSVFYDYGSVTLVEVPFKAVFVEVVEKEIEKKKKVGPAKMKEDTTIAALRFQFDRMANDTDYGDTTFTHRLRQLCECAEDLIIATLALRDIVKNRSPFLYYDFEGPENDSGTCQSFDDDLILASRKPAVQPTPVTAQTPSRLSMSISSSTSSSPPPVAADTAKKSKTDAYATQEILYNAVCKFPATQLPRNRIYWQQQLFALNIQEGKTAEAAGVKMEIVHDLKKVMSIVEEMWSIRRPIIDIHRNREQTDKASPDTPDDMSLTSSPTSTPAGSMASMPNVQSNDFASIVEAVDNSPPNKAFSSHRHVVGIIVSSLRTALNLYCEQGLLFLADDAARELLLFLRAENNLKEMQSVYEKMGRLYASAGEVDLSFAMGSYFRVAFLGSIVPDNLRNKEFVYRMPSHLHVSEFHAHIETSLRDVIRETQTSGGAGKPEVAVTVKLLKDAAEEPPADDPSQAATGYIKITALKSIRWAGEGDSVEDVAAVIRSSSTKATSTASTGSNQLRLFKFDIPFTPGGKVHGEILDQCKNTTVVSVNVPFPCALSRQLVAGRCVVVRRPIEVAMDDVRQRISEMEAELHRTDIATDKNNLKRLVQGSVMPQVNAGAAAVATTFLKAINSDGDMPELILVTGDDEAELLRRSLREVFVAFLDLCSALLAKSTRLLTPIMPPSPKKGDTASEADTIWLSEMKKGYGSMVDIMYPLVRQGEGALDMIQSRRFLVSGGDAGAAAENKFTSHDSSAPVKMMT